MMFRALMNIYPCNKDASCVFMAESEGQIYLQNNSRSGAQSVQNKKIRLEPPKNLTKWDRLKEKDQGFCNLECSKEFRHGEIYSTEDDTNDDGSDWRQAT